MSTETENLRLGRVLKHGVKPGDLGASSWADKVAIAAWQAKCGLKPDGVFGPRSLDVWRKLHKVITPKGAALIESVLRAESTSQIPTTRTFGRLGFQTKYWKPRTGKPTAIVIHDTVSHTAEAAQRTLDKEGYATHFFVDLDGTVLQCMDPGAEYGSHCAGLNEPSIGIDVVAILDPSYANNAEKTRTVERAWSASKRKGKVIDYTPAQKLVLPALCRSLCDSFGIPHYVLDAAAGYGEKVPGLSPAFRGVLAHAQWSSKRWDGLFGIEALLAAGGWEHDPGAWTGPRVAGAE